MNEPNVIRQGDQDLRGRFDELRAETASPSFAAVLERAAADAREQPALGVVLGAGTGTRGRILKVGAWGSAAIAATVAGLLLFDGSATSTANADEEFADLIASYSADMSSGAWRSPTSALLEVPGIELIRSVPSIGLTPDVGAAR
jgi:hypothetical protein